MNSYEIEIKSLLGDKENADALIEKLKNDPTFESLGSHSQLNHYFVDGNLSELLMQVYEHLEKEKQEQLNQIAEHATDFSVRTRLADGKVILVVKATLDGSTSFN